MLYQPPFLIVLVFGESVFFEDGIALKPSLDSECPGLSLEGFFHEKGDYILIL
tara:strand:- start:438 stop:596 length:159 start_codon:yes stop_codon:yes gene_type:complete